MPHKMSVDLLKAERSGIQSLMDESRNYGDPLGVMQCEDRLESIDEEIAKLESEPKSKANLALFFGGKPVVGSQGIRAEFASKALSGFQELISKAFATHEGFDMGERGRIPMRENSDLMVTGVVHGSFGFVMDEISVQDELHQTPLKDVVKDVTRILHSAGSDLEEEFEESSEKLDNRTLQALREFFSQLDSNHATLRVVEDENEIFLGEEHITRARERIENTRIEEEKSYLEGRFLGLLPESRKFDFELEDGNVISGPVTEEAVEQYERLTAQGSLEYRQLCKVEMNIRTVIPVKGDRRTNYKLTGFDFGALPDLRD